ncbi:MAG TPA: Crp/Fnr family transcriptional regulator [Candidatus Saccharimonadales bacterium]|nr:Crp/Fnr family transcriptional regulator [Candidatus Saccharimonadales bacterium]
MEDWRTFLANYPCKRYEKGQLIVCQDTSPNCCYVIKSGFVKTYLITAEGNEKPLSFEARNDFFPVDTTFGHSEEARYFYEAYTDCEIYQIPRAEYVKFINDHPRIFTRLFHYLIKRTLDYHEHISSLEQAKAVDKLICALHLLVKRFGKQVAKSRAHMTLPLTQQDLANFLGLTRETTGTQLKALEREGILQYHRQKYVIHTDRLATLVEER